MDACTQKRRKHQGGTRLQTSSQSDAGRLPNPSTFWAAHFQTTQCRLEGRRASIATQCNACRPVAWRDGARASPTGRVHSGADCTQPAAPCRPRHWDSAAAGTHASAHCRASGVCGARSPSQLRSAPRSRCGMHSPRYSLAACTAHAKFIMVQGHTDSLPSRCPSGWMCLQTACMAAPPIETGPPAELPARAGRFHAFHTKLGCRGEGGRGGGHEARRRSK